MPDDDKLVDLLVKWEDLHEQGQDMTAEELCRECPELVQPLKERIQAIQKIAWIKKPVESDPSEPEPPPAVPRTLAGRYRLDRLLREGGFGQVWKGFDLELQRPVAVKIPKPSRRFSAEEVERFMAEARKLARLRHPGIVAVHDICRESGGYFFVSDLIDGTDLAARLRQGRLPTNEAARIVAEVARILAYAHGQGLIHRDIKPAKILLDGQNNPLLTDFGIAATEQELLQESQRRLATLAYASPEQVSGQVIDARSDLWGLGVVLYELLSGRLPFDDPSPVALKEKIVFHDPPTLRRLDPAIPPQLERICLKCLAKDPAQRYASAQELADELSAFLQPPRPKKRKLLTLGGVLALAGVVGLLAFWSDLRTGRSKQAVEEEKTASAKRPEMRRFNLDFTDTSDEGLKQFDGMTDLGELRLTKTKVTDAGLVFLKGCPALQFLDLHQTKITDAGLEHLAGLSELQNLGLSATPITDDGLKHLRGLKKLSHLNLDYTQISDAGLDHLKDLTDLTDLRLTKTRVTDAGLKKLVGLKKLRTLDLHHTRITDAGLEALAELPDLQDIGLAGTKITEAGLKKLKKPKPPVGVK